VSIVTLKLIDGRTMSNQWWPISWAQVKARRARGRSAESITRGGEPLR
jgi:hypothetical protein